mmetsp:Transcript_61979/g.55919  ORF Transcript_61979/g.55919 Transcript_61979/m.55919 type:complete len:132 (-) Transcript_61979:177-572(-)
MGGGSSSNYYTCRCADHDQYDKIYYENGPVRWFYVDPSAKHGWEHNIIKNDYTGEMIGGCYKQYVTVHVSFRYSWDTIRFSPNHDANIQIASLDSKTKHEDHYEFKVFCRTFGTTNEKAKANIFSELYVKY